MNGFIPTKVKQKSHSAAHHKPKPLSKAAQLINRREDRFKDWAKGIDTNHDGTITTAELQSRIDERTAAGKEHPYASAIKDNLSTLDPTNTGGVSQQTATDFLTTHFNLNDTGIKKLDTTA